MTDWTRETEHLVGRGEVFWANWPKCIQGLTKKKGNGRDKVNTALGTQQTGTKEQAPGEGSILEDSTDNAAGKHAEDKVSRRIWKLLLYYTYKAIMETWESTAFTDNWSVAYKVFTKVSEGQKKKSSLRQNFVKSDLVEILTNNLLVPAEIEVAVTKKKGENQSMTKKSEYKILKITTGKNIYK